MTTKYDVIVIGAGQSGVPLATRMASAGKKTLLIEREHLGGTCVNDGCIPTKTLIASARTAYVARRAADYGVQISGEIRVDMKAVKARKDAVVQESVTGLTKWLSSTPNLSVVFGHARFVSPHAVQVDGVHGVNSEVMEAAQIFINTGARPVVPDWPGLADVPYLTNTSMMALDELPEHLLIVGGSYIGLEFAQMYRRFGARVTVVEQGDRIIAREDAEVSSEVQAILEREGVQFVLGARDMKVALAASGKNKTDIHFSALVSGKKHELLSSHLLLAVGRKPNSDDLGLQAAGIAIDKRGYITVDDELRTNVAGVWAMGDINGRGAFTHTSYNDFEIIVANLLNNDPRRVSDRIMAYALYIDPPLARIGMSETEVRASGKPALVGVMQMARVGRARERGETQGFMKVLVDAQTKRILGAALLGIEADEVIHSLLDIMAADVPYTVIQRTMHIHPTVSELVPTLLGSLKPLVFNQTSESTE
jgi:pyruvate/2-oxoglutarate dehydrogenase complex dihydrolipoamide dehydrogenase (E3) component